jgi:hypothetical protein
MFPFDYIISSDVINSQEFSIDQLHSLYQESQGNIITFLQHFSMLKNNKKDVRLLWHKHVEKLLQKLKQEKNNFNAIRDIRETVYKLYHIGIPLKDLCHYIIKISSFTEKEKIYDIINVCANSENEGLNQRNILYYESLLCNIYKLISS